MIKIKVLVAVVVMLVLVVIGSYYGIKIFNNKRQAKEGMTMVDCSMRKIDNASSILAQLGPKDRGNIQLIDVQVKGKTCIFYFAFSESKERLPVLYFDGKYFVGIAIDEKTGEILGKEDDKKDGGK